MGFANVCNRVFEQHSANSLLPEEKRLPLRHFILKSEPKIVVVLVLKVVMYII